RARIRLAAGRHVAVRGDVAKREALAQRAYQGRKLCVLRIREGRSIRALELDAEREVIAALAAAPSRSTGVPGTAMHRHELQQCTIAAHEKVCGHFQRMDLPEIRMQVRIEPVGEEPLDRIAAVFARRKAD